MEEIYYIIDNGSRKGPYSKEGLRLLNITPETYIWRAGMDNWQHASSLPELADIFSTAAAESAFGGYAQPEPEVYFAMFGSSRVGPDTIENLIRQGLNESTPVWRNGMADWVSAGSVPEIRAKLSAAPNPSAIPPQPPFSGAQYAPGSPMPQQPAAPHTNWMTWAIVATVAGFLCGGCIAGIFGIIAINKAQKANAYYNIGDAANGDLENSSARTWTIISLVLSVLGLIGSAVYLANFNTIYSQLYNF